MIEIRHLDVRHFVIQECRHLANGCNCIQMWLQRFDVISLSIIMSCRNNMRYNYSVGFVSVHTCKACDALIASCAAVH